MIDKRSYEREWVITEGASPNETIHDEGANDVFMQYRDLRHAFIEFPVRNGVNKTIFVWPEGGTGIIVGLIRREIGESVRGYTDSYNGEYEPGYFCTKSRHWLYVVKTTLSGTNTILVPMWAATAIEKP